MLASARQCLLGIARRLRLPAAAAAAGGAGTALVQRRRASTSRSPVHTQIYDPAALHAVWSRHRASRSRIRRIAALGCRGSRAPRRPRGKVARAAADCARGGGARARAARAADGARPDLHQVWADALDPSGRDPAGGGVRAAEALRRRAVVPDGGGARAHRGGARPAGGGALRRPRRELDADRRRLARPGVPLPAARERRGDRAQGPAARHDPVSLARPLAAHGCVTARLAAAAKLSTARRSAPPYACLHLPRYMRLSSSSRRTSSPASWRRRPLGVDVKLLDTLPRSYLGLDYEHELANAERTTASCCRD